MKSLKALKNLGQKEKKALLEDAKKELIKLHAQRAIGASIENPGRIRALRRTIARIYTLEAAPVTKLKQAKGGQK